MSNDTTTSSSQKTSTFRLISPTFEAPAAATFQFGAPCDVVGATVAPTAANNLTFHTPSPTASLNHAPFVFSTPFSTASAKTITSTFSGAPTSNVFVTPPQMPDGTTTTGFFGNTPPTAPVRFQIGSTGTPVAAMNGFGGNTSLFGSTAIAFGLSSAPSSTIVAHERPILGVAASATTTNFYGGGTHIAPYQETSRLDGNVQIYLHSISAMEPFKDLSQEELRFTDYMQGNFGMTPPLAPALAYQVTSCEDIEGIIHLQSISAMDQCKDLSHEELRFADYVKSNGTTSLGVANTGGIGAPVPAQIEAGTSFSITSSINTVSSISATDVANSISTAESEFTSIKNVVSDEKIEEQVSYVPVFERTIPNHPTTTMKSLTINTESMLQLACSLLVNVPSIEVTFRCEGTLSKMFLILVATREELYIFDCVTLEAQDVCNALKPLLEHTGILKLIHDSHNTAALLNLFGNISEIHCVYDTQLPMEAITGEWDVGFKDMLEECGLSNTHSVGTTILDEDELLERPISLSLKKSFLDDARNIHDVFEYHLSNILVTPTNFTKIIKASYQRFRYAAQAGGKRSLCFCKPPAYKVRSYEYAQEIFPSLVIKPSPIVALIDVAPLLQILPEDIKTWVGDKADNLFEIVLDKGRTPTAWIGHERAIIGGDNTNRIVSERDISHITARLGKFGSDNRVGLEKQLHRISAIRNRHNDIIGLTMRIGRHVSGSAYMISDLLFCHPNSSILILGEPGSGKTTVVREVTRLLAERRNVCIVDTSNEIAGDGDVPHPCVGHARRLMVQKGEMQSDVMIECVQNHTPDVIVIDEIGRSNEVDAVRTCKNRGVRLIASAHGDLRQLVQNPKLRGLVGGIDRVIVGDEEARKRARNKFGKSIQKTKSERAGSPTFEMIVELKRGAHHEWTIILDAGAAVDQILDGGKYPVQRRTQNPHTGTFHLVEDKA